MTSLLLTLALLTQKLEPPRPPVTPPPQQAEIFADGLESGTPSRWGQVVGHVPTLAPEVVVVLAEWPLFPGQADRAYLACELAQRTRAVRAQHGPVFVAYHYRDYRVYSSDPRAIDRYTDNWCSVRGYLGG